MKKSELRQIIREEILKEQEYFEVEFGDMSIVHNGVGGLTFWIKGKSEILSLKETNELINSLKKLQKKL